MIERTFAGLAAAVAACLVTFAPVVVRAEEPVPAGTWKGTVGSAAVMVCFAQAGESEYYYLRHKRGIHLWPSGDERDDNRLSAEAIAKAWRSGRLELDERAPSADGEGKASGHWQLEAKSATEVTGTWTAPAGGKTVAISLQKLSSAEPQAAAYGTACGPAYYEPIRGAIQLKYKPAQFEGHAYREVSSEEGTAIEVPASMPHAGEFNRYALGWLRDQSAIAYDCNANRSDGVGDHIGSSLSPVVWTPQFLVLQDMTPEIYCGGAHGSSSLSYVTWAIERGKFVDTWGWLQGGQKALVAHEDKQGQTIKSGLFRLIARAHPRNAEGDDCKDVLDQMSVLAPYPTGQGLVFPTDFFHAMRACNDEVTIAWKQLAPYLSAEGRILAERWPRPGR